MPPRTRCHPSESWDPSICRSPSEFGHQDRLASPRIVNGISYEVVTILRWNARTSGYIVEGWGSEAMLSDPRVSPAIRQAQWWAVCEPTYQGGNHTPIAPALVHICPSRVPINEKRCETRPNRAVGNWPVNSVESGGKPANAFACQTRGRVECGTLSGSGAVASWVPAFAGMTTVGRDARRPALPVGGNQAGA